MFLLLVAHKNCRDINAIPSIVSHFPTVEIIVDWEAKICIILKVNSLSNAIDF